MSDELFEENLSIEEELYKEEREDNNNTGFISDEEYV